MPADPRDSNQEGVSFIRKVFDAAGPRPSRSDPPAVKIDYAVRFADHAAEALADDLIERLTNIRATTKRSAQSVRSKKQLDVNFSTPQLGLALGISLKSVHVRDSQGTGRYTHNMKRNEEELRIEASGYHKRQPYAVMIGVLFLPFDCADDARGKTPSSFGSWVRHLRPFAGRESPDDEIDKFEKIFIALYEPDGSDLRLFDVQDAPPRQRRPDKTLTYREFLAEVYHAYLHRNEREFSWAEGDEDPLEVDDDGEEGENGR